MDMSNFNAAMPGQVTLQDAMVAQALETSSVSAEALPPSPEGEGNYTAAKTSVITPEGEGNYTAAPEAKRLDDIAAEVRAIAEYARGVAVSAALGIGRRLIEARNLCQRGRFSEWLAANVDFSERKAQDMMRLYEQYGNDTLPEAIARLDYSKAVALLAAPEGEREALAEKAEAEGLSVRQLNEEVKRLRAEAADQQQRMEIESAEAYREGAAHGAEAQARALEAMRTRAEAAEERARSIEDSMKVVRDTAAKANDRAAEAEESLNEMRRMHAKAEAEAKELRKALKEAEKTAEPIEVVPADVSAELDALRAEVARLKADGQRTRMAGAPLPSAPAALPPSPEEEGDYTEGQTVDELSAAMDGVKAAITRAVSAIKAAEPSAAKRAKDGLLVICTAIVKKLGGATND